jgi:hypothetical protein
VKISAQETLPISSWSEKVQYSALKESLGVSTSLHLQQNVFVREILGLGPPPLRADPISKGDKIEMVGLLSCLFFFLPIPIAFRFVPFPVSLFIIGLQQMHRCCVIW